jgi:hypothetical protein
VIIRPFLPIKGELILALFQLRLQMEKRTESDMVAKAPVKVRLGDKDYRIPVLTVLPARDWRIKLNTEFGSLTGNFKVIEATDSNAMASAMTFSLIEFPEKVADLIFTYRTYGFLWESVIKEGLLSDLWYPRFLELLAAEPLPEAPDFPRAEILANATEEQLATAFSAVMAVAYPFLPQLTLATQVMASSATRPQLAKFTN